MMYVNMASLTKTLASYRTCVHNVFQFKKKSEWDLIYCRHFGAKITKIVKTTELWSGFILMFFIIGMLHRLTGRFRPVRTKSLHQTLSVAMSFKAPFPTLSSLICAWTLSVHLFLDLSLVTFPDIAVFRAILDNLLWCSRAAKVLSPKQDNHCEELLFSDWLLSFCYYIGIFFSD